MKFNAETITLAIGAFVWSIFMGVTAISIGFGAIYPPMNRIAAPFVCPNGQMEYVQNVSHPVPGSTYVQASWTCVNELTGKETEIDLFPLSIYSGIFYGLLLFVVVAGIWYISQRRNASLAQSYSPDRSDEHTEHLGAWSASERQRAGDSDSALGRMKQLKELRDANMISESEYERKRTEILRIYETSTKRRRT